MPRFFRGKRRRTFKGRARKRMRRAATIPRRKFNPPFHRYKRSALQALIDVNGGASATASFITQSATTPQTFQFRFRLVDMAGATELTSLYDHYRIRGVRFQLSPEYTAAVINPQAAVVAFSDNVIHTIIDLDSFTSTLTESQVLEYGNVRHGSIFKPIRRFVRPRVSGFVYDGSANPASAVLEPSKAWIDCGNANVVWNGIGVWIPQAPTGNVSQIWKITVTYYVEFKVTR